MSISAQKWAMEQKVGSASIKFVLLVLSTYADVTGACWPSQETLARDTDQSVPTVQRCLRVLEDRGLIYIGPRRVKKNGHAGTRQYVVLHDSWCVKFALEIGFDPENIGKKRVESDFGDEEAADQRDSEKQTCQNDVSAENAGEQNQIDGEKPCENRPFILTSQEVRAQTYQSDGSADASLVTHQEQPYLNLSPQSPPGSATAGALDEGSWLADWERFREAWVWADGELPEPVRRQFQKLTPEDRRAAVAFVPAYLVEVKRKQGKPMKARRWIGLRGWEPFEMAAKKTPTAKPGSTVFVIKGTPAWAAWAAAKGKPPEKMVSVQSSQNGGRTGWYFPTMFPPGAARREPSRDDDDAVLAREINGI